MRALQIPVWISAAAAILAVQVAMLALYGQPWYCACGYIKLWEGAVLSVGNSQHITDWYTYSHVIHGFLFYALFWRLFPTMSVPARFLLALGLESSWELLENTPWVINHYREQALAAGYVGDSILNSLSDSLAMIVGFLLARRLPVWVIVATALVLEGVVGYSIRDNLTFNIINFAYPSDAITQWQTQAQ